MVENFFLNGVSKNMNYVGNGDGVGLIIPHIYIVFVLPNVFSLELLSLLLDIMKLKEVK